MRGFFRFGVMSCACGAAALVFAMVFIRQPALWFLCPDWLQDTVAKILRPTSAETQNDVELLSAWLLAFVPLMSLGGVWLVVRRGRGRVQARN